MSDERSDQIARGRVGAGAGLVAAPVASVREGWAAAFKALAAGADGGLLDPPTSTRFDREEWEW